MTNKDKIKTMLDSLNDIQEQLLALPDDMLLSIDPRDNESIEEGAEFIKTYNNRLSERNFDTQNSTNNQGESAIPPGWKS